MQFGLLGTLVVHDGAGIRPVAAPKQRIVLASLLVRSGRVVSTDDLVEYIWDDEPPAGARKVVQSYVMRLRRALGPRAAQFLVARSPGYLVNLDAAEFDLREFNGAIARSRTAADAGDWLTAADQLRHALAKFRGQPLQDVPSVILQRNYVPNLIEHGLQGHEMLADAEMQLGQYHAAAIRLAELAVDHPTRESLHLRLMTMLQHLGRRVEALAVYRQLRESLVSELGVEPSADLQSLHQRLLHAGDGPVTMRGPVVIGAGAAAIRPMQLPPAVTGFVGRSDLLAALDQLIAAGDEGAPRIAVVTGMAGVGKTTAVVHWAHRIAGAFPDGQLYASLRGFDPGGSPAHPAEVVRGFLDALAVPSYAVPASLDAQVGLYRSLVAERQILVLLDNARDMEQVRPLLPAGRGSVVVVTSRNQFAGLVAAQGARSIAVGLLSRTHARELLQRRLGAARTSAESAAVDNIIEGCARLPVALAIVAARAATRPGLPLTRLASDLTTGLDGLHDGDPQSSMRAVFSWSYHALSSQAADLFRLLATHPGPTIGLESASNMAGRSRSSVRPLLAELVHASLLTDLDGRYAFHDLVRVYGIEVAHQVDGADAVRAGLHRLLDHCCHTVRNASVALHKSTSEVQLSAPGNGVNVLSFTDSGAASTWFAEEDGVLLSAVRAAAAASLNSRAWQLSLLLYRHLEASARWHDIAATDEIAVEAATRDRQTAAASALRRELARAYIHLGRTDDALSQLRITLDFAEKAGDPEARGDAHISLAYLCDYAGDLTGGLEHARSSLVHYRAAANARGEGLALNCIGFIHAELGLPEAVACCQEAVAILRSAGAPEEAACWDSLGLAHHQLGHNDKAVACYRRAIELFQNSGNQYGETTGLENLARVLATFDPEAARESRQRARSILDNLSSPARIPTRCSASCGGPEQER